VIFGGVWDSASRDAAQWKSRRSVAVCGAPTARVRRDGSGLRLEIQIPSFAGKLQAVEGWGLRDLGVPLRRCVEHLRRTFDPLLGDPL